MQKLSLVILTIVLGVFSVAAQNKEKLVVNAGNMAHIFIANDMDIILLPGSVDDISAFMDATASAKLNLKTSNNRMTISLKRLTKEKLTVYLYVNNLKSITAGNSTTIRTMGILNSAAIDVYIEGEAMAHVKSKGSIKAHPVNDGEIDVTYLQTGWWQRVD